jgi:hypothetical protein
MGRFFVLVAAIASLALVACGGSDEKYYIPVDTQLQPYAAPEADDLVADGSKSDGDDADDDGAGARAAPAPTAAPAPASARAPASAPAPAHAPASAPAPVPGKAKSPAPKTPQGSP